MKHRNLWRRRVSLGLKLLRRGRSSRFTHVQVKEIGDLEGFGALMRIDAKGRILSSAEIAIDQTLTVTRLRKLLHLTW
jgi:hypothetical protein